MFYSHDKHFIIKLNFCLQIWWLVGDEKSAEIAQEFSPKLLVTGEGRWDIDELKRIHMTNVNAEYSEVSHKDIE